MWVSHPKEIDAEKKDAGVWGYRTRGHPDQLGGGGRERRNGTGAKNAARLGCWHGLWDAARRLVLQA